MLPAPYARLAAELAAILSWSLIRLLSSAMDHPVDGITYAQAQLILGRSRSWIGDRIRDGSLPRGPKHKRATLSRAAVEGLALERWTRRRHIQGGYWATPTEVAELFGVTRGWVRQLAEQDLLPGLRAQGKWWLFRREQITVIANSRPAHLLAKPDHATAEPAVVNGDEASTADDVARGAVAADLVGPSF